MRFVKFSALVFLACTTSLAVIFLLLRRGYKTYYTFEQSRLNEIMNGKQYYDALFIGSSRTYYHVNPRIIDSVLGISSYNAGIDGANIVETNMILKCYLQSHPAPKYVIADLSTPAFDVRETSIFNPNIYFPFLNNKVVYNTLKDYKRVALLKYLPFLQITEWDEHIKQGAIAGLIGNHKQLAPSYKGYLESGTDTIPLPFKVTYLTTNYAVTKQGTELFKEMIRMCKQNNIELIISYSPVYDLKDEKINKQFFPTLKKICDSSCTPFLNYRHLSINTNNRLFRDELHLNKFGANVYSNLLAQDIKKMEAAKINLDKVTSNGVK